MKIAFITTQTAAGSTVIGRVLPLARQLATQHDVHVVVHQDGKQGTDAGVSLHYAGSDPFTRQSDGTKKRAGGLQLVITMLRNVLAHLTVLRHIQPDAAADRCLAHSRH